MSARNERYSSKAHKEQERKTARQRRNSRLVMATAAGGIALGLAGGALYVSHEDTPQRAPATSSSHATPTPHNIEMRSITDEAQIDELINKLDSGMENVYSTLHEKLATASPQDRQFLLAPLEHYFGNAQNGERNQMRKAKQLIARATAEGHEPTDAIMDNPNYFLINGISGDTGILAMYNHPVRTLYVPPDFNPNNLFDVSVAYHEIVHAYQSAHIAERFSTQEQMDRYNAMYDQSTGAAIFTSLEADAHMRQVFMVNAITDGQLQQDATAGRIDMTKWHSLLHSIPNQEQAMAVLFNMAGEIYQTGSTPTFYSAEYKKFINDNSRAMGIRVFDFDAAGNVIDVPPGQ